jgi:succinate dehydrogenase / fumarate reductase cytochrome b subunit
MRLNRPLSPHLTVYKPQVTSTLSIFHRLTGAFLAVSLLSSLCFSQLCRLSMTYYPLYYCVNMKSEWFLVACLNLSVIAFSYHMSNGVRHLVWDYGAFLDLSKVYTSAFIMLLCAFLFVIFQLN